MPNWVAEKVIVPHWQVMLEIHSPELVGNLPSRMLEKAIYGEALCWKHSATKLLE